jgi:hypothetical protein
MALDIVGILDRVVSHALASGRFERVNQHEPKTAPGNGLSAAVWVDSIKPAASQSGLAATTALLVINVRIYQNMIAEPQDMIDPNVMAATDALMAAYSGNFTLGSNVRAVDLLGSAGTPMNAQAGYIQQDNRVYRAVTITLPLIINDVWSQAA